MSLRRKIFYAITVATLLLLLVLPATSWLVRLQLMPVYPGSTSGMNYIAGVNTDSAVRNAALQRIATNNPTDFNIQYAIAIQSDGDDNPTAQLNKLRERFPNEPAISATLLRRMCNSAIKLNRDDNKKLYPIEKAPKPTGTPAELAEIKKFEALLGEKEKEIPSSPADLARFDALAALGEKQEPNNAFFPVMRTIGYFAARKDKEAVAAWKRAAEKTEWNDYTNYEQAAQIHLLKKLNGGNEVGLMLRTIPFTLSAADNFPNFANLRSVARIVMVKGVEAELAGNTEEGFELRQATRKVGGIIATKGQLTITNLVGVAVAAVSQTRPGGAPAIKNPEQHPTSESRKAFTKKRQEAYLAYLVEIGHPEEATAYQATLANAEKIKAITNAGMEQSYLGANSKVYSLFFCWFGDGLLIMGVLFSLTFSAIFGLVFRFSPRLQKGEPLQASARWGVTLAILASVALIPTVLLAKPSSQLSWLVFSICVLLGFILPPALLRMNRQQVSHGLLVCLCTLLSIGLIVGVLLLSSGMFQGAVQGAMTAFRSVEPGEDSGETSDSGMSMLIGVLVNGVLMLLPILMLCAFAICSRILRIPVASGVTRGMRAMGVPLACVLVFGYAVCVFATVRQENTAIAEMTRREQIGELQNYAIVTGKPMPVP